MRSFDLSSLRDATKTRSFGICGVLFIVVESTHGIQNETDSMRLTPTLLIVAAALLPAAWGWIMYGLVTKWWPSSDPNVNNNHVGDPGPIPHDYQI
jgi:hypothetical protein